MEQTVTIIINELPYKNDKAWNALRLAGALLDQKVSVSLFLLEDGVDVGKEKQSIGKKKYNLEKMITSLLNRNLEVKACESCLKSCGVSKEKLITRVEISSMSALATLVKESNKVLIF
ncbi:hypothetical protein A3A54_02430 [Candidatus Curtissbacteria bacterium RIFCSPLOWO2_01_FULL_39_62]|uniref:Uncharacterized protein n=1 Tax=Candidatus Curtissbacteria bacterium RIFCSPHIGHO2_02_FULL_40_16b TaxID=1797714 RepID=A0A1F5GBQ0_9BACT|nr:hypothetical protein [uncultured bacterium]OGD82821.1 MAG: hypothetical protein A2775_01645 [Candidatus Curtissbacteria bacterium RIFCSPHIGHO2_01_FULL_39_57]OGD89291.1 MAG: hypothetical protein A3D04_03670 [Candidatus Curtissbacteria bacterium RIFCSPHIGHO2_02_FULL_40_16b]OGD90933.1 MAG: hypothetical protein A3E11_01745 [Candidatus Curtissbacteria bacterium RIFCSPHIGHO2_12_FULL_38_37]OGD99138.1 MAG: hypothetical protein A3J17_01685 [Candidatus Curtissbacteria bacterium RIFCSPLOWO2_02_FULL_40_